jgi:hypothetical protein
MRRRRANRHAPLHLSPDNRVPLHQNSAHFGPSRRRIARSGVRDVGSGGREDTRKDAARRQATASPGTAAGTATTTHRLSSRSALIPHSLCIQVGSGGRRGHPGRHGGCGAAMCGGRRSAGRPRAPAAGHRSGMLLPFTSPTICSPVSSICLSCICSCKKKKIPFAVELNVCTAVWFCL